MHVFQFLLASAIIVAVVSSAPESDYYDSIVDISDGTPEPPEEFYEPEADPEWVKNFGKIFGGDGRLYTYRSDDSDLSDSDLSDSDVGESDLGDDDLDDHDIGKSDLESRIYIQKNYPWHGNYDYRYGRAVANPWLCPAPSSDSAKKGGEIVTRLKMSKIFPQQKSLTESEASDVAAYIRKVDAKVLCPRATGAKMAIPIRGRDPCFVNCAQAPKAVTVERCSEGTVFKPSAMDLYSVSWERSAIVFKAPKGECVKKQVQVQPSQRKEVAQKNLQIPRYEKKGKPFWAPEWLDYRDEDFSDQI